MSDGLRALERNILRFVGISLVIPTAVKNDPSLGKARALP